MELSPLRPRAGWYHHACLQDNDVLTTIGPRDYIAEPFYRAPKDETWRNSRNFRCSKASTRRAGSKSIFTTFEDDVPFNYDGTVSMFCFQNGRVDLKHRYVRTDRFKLERKAGRALFGRHRYQWHERAKCPAFRQSNRRELTERRRKWIDGKCWRCWGSVQRWSLARPPMRDPYRNRLQQNHLRLATAGLP